MARKYVIARASLYNDEELRRESTMAFIVRGQGCGRELGLYRGGRSAAGGRVDTLQSELGLTAAEAVACRYGGQLKQADASSARSRQFNSWAKDLEKISHPSIVRSGKRTARQSLRVIVGLLSAMSAPALAGPPFITDDPEPTDYHKWEIYNFLSGSHEPGSDELNTGLDLNYGAFRDVQLTATLPLHTETVAPLDVGDVELAAKFKLIHQHKETASVDVTVFPRVILPTGRVSSRAQVLLPVWVQRDFGLWSVFGGGGYLINPGPGNRNYWVQGAVVTGQVGKGFQLGLEEFYQGPASDGDRPLTGLNFGALVHLSGPYSLIGSFGQGLNRKKRVFYAALKLDL